MINTSILLLLFIKMTIMIQWEKALKCEMRGGELFSSSFPALFSLLSQLIILCCQHSVCVFRFPGRPTFGSGTGEENLSSYHAVKPHPASAITPSSLTSPSFTVPSLSRCSRCCCNSNAVRRFLSVSFVCRFPSFHSTSISFHKTLALHKLAF